MSDKSTKLFEFVVVRLSFSDIWKIVRQKIVSRTRRHCPEGQNPDSDLTLVQDVDQAALVSGSKRCLESGIVIDQILIQTGSEHFTCG